MLSCSKEVKIDIPGYEEQLVIDGFIETGQPPVVLLSKSKDIYASTDLTSFLNGFVTGATVTVSDGMTTVQLIEICTDNLPPGTESIAAEIFGVSEQQLTNLHLCGYVSLDPAIFGQVGKTYTLTVEYAGKVYTATTKILQPTPLQSVFWKAEADKPLYGFSYAILADPPQKNDAYRWEVKRINKNAEGKNRDANFKKTYNPVFNDEFFNGLTFEFSYENPMSFDDEGLEDQYKGYYKMGDSVVIKLSKMDKGVYDFMIMKYTQIQTGGSPFSSPANIPSNIQGGALGVWAGYSPWFDTLYCVP